MDLARYAIDAEDVTIIEGLFLKATGGYLALVKTSAGKFAVGTDFPAARIRDLSKSAWRNLSIAVGEWLQGPG